MKLHGVTFRMTAVVVAAAVSSSSRDQCLMHRHKTLNYISVNIIDSLKVSYFSNTTQYKLYIPLPCIVIDFFLNNQPDATIIPILFCYETLHVSDISAHHQEFSTVHLVQVSFMQVYKEWVKQSNTTILLLLLCSYMVEGS